MSRTRKTPGFTLLEMTMAMTITAITGLSVAGATIALSRAHQDTEGFYQTLQTARAAMMRIQRTIQSAQLITASSGTTLVFWAADTNGNKKIEADEVLLLVFDSAARQICLYRKVFPEAVRAAMNVEVPLSTLTDTITAVGQVIPSAYAQTTVLATDATDFYATTSPVPPFATRVGLRLSVGSGKTAMMLRSAATTRGAKTALVDTSGGDYILTGD